MPAADIHHQITEVYDTEAVSDSKVRKWVRKFKEWCEQTSMTEERSGRSSVITDDLMQAVETKVRENGRFIATTLSFEFLDVPRSVVHKIVTADLNFKKLCSRWVSRLFTPEHKEKRFATLLDLWDSYEEEGDDMLSRVESLLEMKHGYFLSPRNQSNNGMATRILSRQGYSHTNAVKTQDYGSSVLNRRTFLGQQLKTVQQSSIPYHESL
ncbi:uncharacterized protein TNCV_4776321 [Trichonephila clavipes]|nr:uncharacterized protein TNCV_4776321 [Trichonephila clavipes]